MLFKYEEIIEYIKDGIINNSYSCGDKLPSLRRLCKQFGCSISVVTQSYSELESQGYIKSVEKSGFYVLSSDRREIPTPQNYNHELISLDSKSNYLTGKILNISNRPEIIPFGAAIPDVSLLATKKITRYITDELKKSPDCLSSYTPMKGSLKLRKEISKYLFTKGIKSDHREIVITNGCAEALYLAVMTATNPGDTVAIETPVFFSLITILEDLERKVIEIPTSPDDGMNLDVLESLIDSQKIKAVIFSPSFQNPLCFSMSNSNKKRLYLMACERNLTLIEDDIFGDCSFSGDIQMPVKSIDRENRVIYCSSFSKTLAPGIRIGWTLPGKFLKELSDAKCTSSLGGSVLIQEAIANYLKSGNYLLHLKRFQKDIFKQTIGIRNLIINFFPNNTKISKPTGGYFLWIELDNRVDSFELFNRAIKEGISIIPGPIFSISKKYNNCIRVSCAAPLTKENISALKLLGSIIPTMYMP